MKKVLTIILIVILSFSTLVFFTGCKNVDNSSSNSEISNDNSTNSDLSNDSSETNSSVNQVVNWSSEAETITPATTINNGEGDGILKTTVFFVGDSTVCEYTPTGEKSRYYMRNGYGMWVGTYLNDNVTINNLALSGRSSKSFLSEANYNTLLTNIKAGDYLFIGFGHNDEKLEQKRFTNPAGWINDPNSFKYHLYNYYIKVALDKGATPILCTPIVRRTTGSYTGSVLHVTSGGVLNNVNYPGGDYAKAIKELGLQVGVTVIDLTTITKNEFSSKTADETANFYARSNLSLTAIDNTHLNIYGAKFVAYKLVEALKTTENSLKNYALDTLTEPDISILVPTEDLINNQSSASTSTQK